MPIISLINQKGGTGKTTTTLNLGSSLAKKGKKVLLIDMDSQGNLGYCLGLDDGISISDVLKEEETLESAIQEKESMHIIPSDIRLVDVELSLIEMDDRHQVLHAQLSTLKKQYDYILIDCPPSLSVLTVNALYASDYVIVPMQMEVLSLQGLNHIIETIEKINSGYKKKLKILGILPVMVDKRRKLSQEVKEYIQENYDLKVFDTMIRSNVTASEAPSFGQSVIAYRPKSNSAIDYMQFADEIIQVI